MKKFIAWLKQWAVSNPDIKQSKGFDYVHGGMYNVLFKKHDKF